jgi:hypothetical protein
MNMKNLFTLVAVVVTAVSLIGTTQAFAQSNKKGSGAYALIPNNSYTAPSSIGLEDRFGEASQR